MGLLDKMFGKGGAKGAVKDMVQSTGTKKERMRKEYDERVAKEPNVNRAYLLHSLEQKYEREPEFESQKEREPQRKEKSAWDKFVDMGSNVNANIERESGFMGSGGNFGGGFGEIDLTRIAGFGTPKQERKYHPKKHKKHHEQKSKTRGKSITINL